MGTTLHEFLVKLHLILLVEKISLNSKMLLCFLLPRIFCDKQFLENKSLDILCVQVILNLSYSLNSDLFFVRILCGFK